MAEAGAAADGGRRTTRRNESIARRRVPAAPAWITTVALVLPVLRVALVHRDPTGPRAELEFDKAPRGEP